MWDRKLEILKLRWNLKDSSELVENPTAKSKWVYNPALNRMVRVYRDDFRVLVKFVGIPLLAILFLCAMAVFVIVAFSGMLMYQLPKCEDCQRMAKYHNPSVYYSEINETGQYPINPYDRFFLHVNLTTSNRSWNEFGKGWLKQTGACRYSPIRDESDCVRAALFLGPILNALTGQPATCWDKPSDFLTGACIPFVIWTILGQAIAALFAFLLRKTAVCLCKLVYYFILEWKDMPSFSFCRDG